MKKINIIVLSVMVLTVLIDIYTVFGDQDSEIKESVYKPLPGENENTFIDNPSTLQDNAGVYQELPGEPGDSFDKKGKLKDEEKTQEYDSANGLLPAEEMQIFNEGGKLIDEGSTNEEASVSRDLPGEESQKDYAPSGKLTDDNATDDKSIPPTYTDKD